MDTDFDMKHWNNVKGKLKNLYPQLTDSDVMWRHETKNDLFVSIATKLVISRKEFSEIVSSI